jgi:hypothetical protein
MKQSKDKNDSVAPPNLLERVNIFEKEFGKLDENDIVVVISWI